MLARHKSSIAVDLKSKAGVALVKKLASTADILIDPFRPGVLEKLGLGPDVLCGANPRLIYGRMTGFRRDGKYAAMAGHDINYLAVSGVLSMLGRSGQKPHAPWNILGDFAGGGATLFQGLLLAVVARERSGKGQVVEANMVDGASYLATFPRMALKTPAGDHPRGQNALDGGSPWYDTYETSDGRYVSVGAIEPQFFRELVRGLGLEGAPWASEARRQDRANWPAMRREFDATFRSRSRADWERVFDGTDACCVPVLEYPELEDGQQREGDQRPAVGLRDTPCLAVAEGVRDPPAQGQGSGVDGAGYYPNLLGVGEGGEDAVARWLGWAKGREFDVQNGGLVLKGDGSKL